MIKVTTTEKSVTIETSSYTWNIVKSRIKGQIPYASGTRLFTEMGEVTLPFVEVQGNGDSFGDAEELQAWVETNCFSSGGGSGEGEQGPKGDDGVTPHIDGDTGNWFLDTTDTGVKAQGPQGMPGNNGNDGNDGREVEFNKSATHIQWRYVGGTTWTNLVALSEIKGDEGPGSPEWFGTRAQYEGISSPDTGTNYFIEKEV